MFNKPALLLIFLHFTIIGAENHNWDIATVVKDRVELLWSNGSSAGSSVQEYSVLKAITFDNIRNQFLVSAMEESSDMTQAHSQNDTIFTVRMENEANFTVVVQDLQDDVQGLSIDSFDDVLYWTDSFNRTINSISLNSSNLNKKLVTISDDKSPQDIAVDLCGRKIYWTNSNTDKPTIERMNMDGSDSETIISSDIFAPYGIAIDRPAKRIYWTDMREGIYYRIESASLDGKERQLVHEGTHSKPFGIAVDSDFIYWTDVSNNALWRLNKYNKQSPKQIKVYHDKPMGIIANQPNIKNKEDCKNLVQVRFDSDKIYQKNSINQEINRSNNKEEDQPIKCLNDGEFINGICHCKIGYVGKYCENYICHNYCLYDGFCYLSKNGFPKCNCSENLGGRRCERNMCDQFCLNGGECSYSHNSRLPKCTCQEGYAGLRCETVIDNENICKMFCEGKESDILTSTYTDFLCRCEAGSYKYSKYNMTAEKLTALSSEWTLEQHLRDPAFLMLSAVVLVLIVVIIALSYFVCSSRNRPRIKKRIIVNKNLTPLKCSPQAPSEQCEITIENCCNMNVCETPCFEPPKLRFMNPRKDDERKLISNMENGEDIY